ncbi:hypothetical protein D1605_011140 [Xylella fastidiosa subsp. fastidiosa]|nr:hypothetical protein [Xylella fastidiosa]NMR12329.1 hypothetical protein [Xylella fastidiosa]QGJ38561.2 hypothetical protein FG899_11685 [Xylella fastidiosa subsp. fastidiosa]QMT64868.1 hypothetical protein D1605_011140 [Xylella fastidiosa subsp. fastidiosa]QPC06472.1 hypothetical protein IUD22_11050 [Xylella fastidiosa subsp. fastidiosa]WCF17278.1 hypothetical protein OK116_11410 [Xylella fastidiosa subsp. fastidiosa]
MQDSTASAAPFSTPLRCCAADMGIWGYGDMGIWGYGDMGIWGYGDMGMWGCGVVRSIAGRLLGRWFDAGAAICVAATHPGSTATQVTRHCVHMEGRWCLRDVGINVGSSGLTLLMPWWDAVIQADRLLEQPMWCCKHARNTTAPLHTHKCVCLLGF